MDLQSRAEPHGLGLERAIELADEFGMSVVLVRLRAQAPEDLAARLLAEAELEAAEMLIGQEWPVWHREIGEQAAFVVTDGAPRTLKKALVELEDSHDLGPWFNLDLVTLVEGGPDVWHGSPDRPEPRPLRAQEDLDARLQGYDWSIAPDPARTPGTGK